MAIKLTNKGGGADLPPIPADTHQAVCYGIVDVGTHKPKNPAHKPTRKLVMLFELPFERADFGDKGNLPRGISCTLTQSLSENAILRKFLKSWRGRDFKPEELEGFDPKVLIGQNCNLVISNNNSSDGTKVFSNIDGILPLRKEKRDTRTNAVIEAAQTKMVMENKPLYFSLDEQHLTNLKFPDNMPKWIQQKISFSEEVVLANGGEPPSQGHADDPAAREAHEEEVRKYDERSRSGGNAPRPSAPAPQENLDEDVPF